MMVWEGGCNQVDHHFIMNMIRLLPADAIPEPATTTLSNRKLRCVAPPSGIQKHASKIIIVGALGGVLWISIHYTLCKPLFGSYIRHYSYCGKFTLASLR